MVTVISVITRLCWGNIESLELSQLSSQQWTLDSHKLVYHVQLSYNPKYSSGTIVASTPGSTQTRQFSPTFAFTSRRAPKTQSHALVSCFSNFLCSNPSFFQTSCVQTSGCHSAPPDCPSRSPVHPPSPEVHIWSLMIDQYWKDKKHSSKCTVYNLPSPHCTRPTNVILEQLPFRRESILTVCCQQNVRRDGKWKYFVESASFSWRHPP